MKCTLKIISQYHVYWKAFADTWNSNFQGNGCSTFCPYWNAAHINFCTYIQSQLVTLVSMIAPYIASFLILVPSIYEYERFIESFQWMQHGNLRTLSTTCPVHSVVPAFYSHCPKKKNLSVKSVHLESQMLYTAEFQWHKFPYCGCTTYKRAGPGLVSWREKIFSYLKVERWWKKQVQNEPDTALLLIKDGHDCMKCLSILHMRYP